MISPLITLFGAILSMVAVALLPGRKAMQEGKDERYSSWGRGALYFMVIVLFAIVGYVIIDVRSSKEPGAFSTGNIALFLVVGIGLVIDDLWISRKMKAAKGAEEVHEVEVMSGDEVKGPEGAAPAPAPEKPAKPGTKKLKKTAKKKVLPTKPVEAPKPDVAATAELIEPHAGPIICPSCDTPVEHTHDGTCPVCGGAIGK